MTTAMQAAMVVAAAEGRRQTMAVAGSGAAKFAAREVVRGALLEIGAQSIRWLLSQFGVDWDPTGIDPYPPGGGEGSGDGKCWILRDTDSPAPITALNQDGVESFGQNAVEIISWQYQVVNGVVKTEVADIVYRPSWDVEPIASIFGIGTGTIEALYLTLFGQQQCEAAGPD